MTWCTTGITYATCIHVQIESYVHTTHTCISNRGKLGSFNASKSVSTVAFNCRKKHKFTSYTHCIYHTHLLCEEWFSNNKPSHNTLQII